MSLSELVILEANVAPNAPTLSSPSNGGTASTTTPTLQWSDTDADSDKISYEVQVATNTAFTTAGSTNTGAVGASTFGNDATVGTFDWTNPSNAGAEDGVSATINTAGSLSHYLTATNFGFAIPVGSTIDGIMVEVKRSSALADAAADNSVKLIVAGTVSGTDKAAVGDWPSSLTYASYGGSSDTWGLTLAPSDINNSTFGFAISANDLGDTGTDGNIDYIRMTVYYTTVNSIVIDAGSATSNGFADVTTPATPSITHVQKIGSATDNSISSFTVAPTTATTSGNDIIVAVSWYVASGSYPTCAITDSAGNSYTVLYSFTGSSGTGPSVLVVQAHNSRAVGTNQTITATFTGTAPFATMTAHEFSGVGAIQDGSNAVNNGTGTVMSFGTLTTTNAVDAVLAIVAPFGNLVAPTWSTGWSNNDWQSAGPSIGMAWQLPTSTGSFSGTATIAASETWRSLVIGLQANANNTFTSGDSVSYTVPAGSALTNGNTYYWRVRSADPLASGNYGSWSGTDSFTVSTGGGADTISVTDSTTTVESVAVTANLSISVSDATTTSESLSAIYNPVIFVQNITARNTGAVFSSSVKAGDLIVAVVGNMSNTTHVSSIADTLGNSYTLAKRQQSNQTIEVWYATASSGGANTVTPTLSGSTGGYAIEAWEFNNADVVQPDNSVGSSAVSASPASIGSVSTTLTGDAILAAILNESGNPFVAASGYANYITKACDGLGDSLLASANTIVGPTGSYTVSFGLLGTETWDGVGVAIRSLNAAAALTVSVSDSSATSESVVVSALESASITDSTSTSENVALTATTQLSVLDATVSSESISAMLTGFVRVSDSATSSEVVSPQLTLTVSATDATASAENISTQALSFVKASDAAVTAEINTVLIPTYLVSVADSSATSDAVLNIVDQDGIAILDATATAESVTVAPPLAAVSIADSSATAETVTVATVCTINVADSTTISESYNVVPQTTLAVADSVAVVENDITDTLGAWWRFQGNTNDISGQGNTAVNHGATLTTDRFGNSNSAYAFSGSAEYMLVADGGSLDTETYTITGWLNSSVAPATQGVVFEKLSGSTFTYALRLKSTGKLVFSASDGTNTPAVSTVASLVDGSWHFFAVSRVQGGQILLYVDTGTPTSTTDTTTAGGTLNSGAIGIGSRNDGVTAPYTGALGDFRLYDRVLSPTELAQVYSESPYLSVSTQIAAADSTTTSEVVSVLAIGNGVFASDATATSEAITILIPTLFGNTADASTMSEGTQLLLTSVVQASDSTTTSEAIGVTATVAINVADTTATTEAVAANEANFVQVTDSITSAESINRLVSIQTSVTDSTTSGESLTVLLPLLYMSVSESAVTSEAVSVNLVGSGAFATDATSVTEAVTVLIPTYLPTVSDTTATSDAVAVAITGFLSVADTTATTESVAALVTSNISVFDGTIPLEGRLNYILDPSFEAPQPGTGLSFGNGSAGTTTGLTYNLQDATYALYGTYSASLQATNAGQYYLNTPNAFTPVFGVTYTFSAYVYVPVGSTFNHIGIGIRDYVSYNYILRPDGTGNELFYTVTPGQWTRVWYTAVGGQPYTAGGSPSPTWRLTVADAQGGTAAAQSWYVDGVMLEASSTVGTYFDGSTVGSGWSGTANQSTSYIPSWSQSITSFAGLSDTTTTAESVGVQEQISLYVSDSTASIETVAAYSPNLFDSVADSSVTTESIAVHVVGSGAFATDASSVTEAVTVQVPVYPLSVADSTTTSEQLSVQPQVSLAVADSTTTSEVSTLRVTSSVGAVDTSTTSETIVLQPTGFISVVDATATTEVVAALIPTLLVSVADSSTTTDGTLTLLDQDGIVVGDSAVTAEAVSVQIVSATPDMIAVTDATTTSEAASVRATANVTALETATTLDSVTVVIPTLLLAVSDATTTMEAVQTGGSLGVSVVDAATSAETIATITATGIAAAETSVTTEAVTLSVSTSVVVADTTATTEAVGAALNPIFITITDSISTADAPILRVSQIDTIIAAVVLRSPKVYAVLENLASSIVLKPQDGDPTIVLQDEVIPIILQGYQTVSIIEDEGDDELLDENDQPIYDESSIGAVSINVVLPGER